jgi:hypothetical protein
MNTTDLLNNCFKEIHDLGIKVYDIENRDFYISEFKFCPESNKLLFETVEENPMSVVDKLTIENAELKLRLEASDKKLKASEKENEELRDALAESQGRVTELILGVDK